jgi:hypothetical protein
VTFFSFRRLSRERLAGSPGNCPGPWTVTRVSAAPEGRTTSSSPETTTKNGTALSPCSTSTSPGFTSRMRPCAATRPICAGVNFGNTCSARELRSGSPRVTWLMVVVGDAPPSQIISRISALMLPQCRRKSAPEYEGGCVYKSRPQNAAISVTLVRMADDFESRIQC